MQIVMQPIESCRQQQSENLSCYILEVLVCDLPYVRGDGYAPFSIIILWTALSISSVVTPGCMQVTKVKRVLQQE